MLELYKDVYDDDLTWVVTDGNINGRWRCTIEEAIESYKFAITPEASPTYGDIPENQDGCTFIASGEDINELRLEELLNG